MWFTVLLYIKRFPQKSIHFDANGFYPCVNCDKPEHVQHLWKRYSLMVILLRFIYGWDIVLFKVKCKNTFSSDGKEKTADNLNYVTHTRSPFQHLFCAEKSIMRSYVNICMQRRKEKILCTCTVELLRSVTKMPNMKVFLIKTRDDSLGLCILNKLL